MWVRSQDRKVLGNFTEFKVLSGEKCLVIGYQGGLDAEGTPLAIYRNEKRAIKILDYMHHTIKVGKNIDEEVETLIKEEVFVMPEI